MLRAKKTFVTLRCTIYINIVAHQVVAHLCKLAVDNAPSLQQIA